MMRLALVSALVGGVLGGVFSPVAWAAGVKSGPQVGERVSAFDPENITGPDAGKKRCLVCKNGVCPVAAIFARDVDDKLALLLKKIDEATLKNKDRKMASFAIFCSNDEKLDKKLQTLAEKSELRSIVLAKDNPDGPEDLNISKDADVTIVLYVKLRVKVNYAFKKGELKNEDIEKIVADVSKILEQ